MFKRLRKEAETNDRISVHELTDESYVHPDRPRLSAVWHSACEYCTPENTGSFVSIMPIPSDVPDRKVVGALLHSSEPSDMYMATVQITAESTPISIYNELVAQMAEEYIDLITNVVEGNVALIRLTGKRD